jgi:hypothetical protein
MFSSPLIAADRTWLPTALRSWVGARLGGPPRGAIHVRRRAAIFLVARLGDFVLGVSAVRRLLDAWGEENCVLVISHPTAALAAREFPRTPLIELPLQAPSLTRDLMRAWWRHRRKFRGLAVEDIVCLSHQRDLYKDTVLSWIGANRRHQLVRATYPQAAEPPLCLELEAHRQLVGAALGRTVSTAEILPRLASVTPAAGDYLLVCPTASEAVRCLPTPLLLGALQEWRGRSRARLVLCSAAAEAGQRQTQAAAIEAAGLGPCEQVQPPDLDALLRLVAGAGAVLAVESAPAHLATALDKPVCVVTGGGSYGLCGPWGHSARQIAVNHRTPCYGCGWRCHQPEVYCYTRIDPAAIAAALPAL